MLICYCHVNKKSVLGVVLRIYGGEILCRTDWHCFKSELLVKIVEGSNKCATLHAWRVKYATQSCYILLLAYYRTAH